MGRSELIRDAVIVVGARGSSSPRVGEFASIDTDAAISGLSAALAQDAHAEWNLVELIDRIPLERLRSESIDARVVQRSQLRRDLREKPPPPIAPDPEFVFEAAEATAHSLSGLLESNTEIAQAEIIGNARYLASEVSELSAKQQQALHDLLEKNWPSVPVSETIQRSSAHSWTISNQSAAWLEYGPALDIQIGPHRWVELASCGVLYGEQNDWLRRNVSEAALDRLSEASASSLSDWLQILRCIPNRIPCRLLEWAADTNKADADPYEVRELVAMITESNCEAALERLKSDPVASDALDPFLAKRGDPDAQLRLARELLGQLQNGTYPEEERLHWLGVPVGEDVLSVLFGCLEVAYDSEHSMSGRGGWMRSTIVSSLLRAIAESDSAVALQHFDELLSRGEAFNFLRDERESCKSRLVDAAGYATADKALATMGLELATQKLDAHTL